MAFGSVLQHTQHNIGHVESSVGVGDHCAGCSQPILEKFLLNVCERRWHQHCVRCSECNGSLIDKCFSRDGKLFCKKDFFRRYGTKCGGCNQGISPSELIRKSRDNKAFHLLCLTCCVCRGEISTGDQLYIVDDNKFLCEKHYLLQKSQHSLYSDPLLGSGSEDEEDDEPTHHIRGSSLGLGALVGLGGNVSDSLITLGPSDMSVQSTNSDNKMTQDDSDQGSIDGDPDCRGDSQAENKSPDDGANGSKRRGPRTTIKAKQLDVLKNAFSQTPKPTRHIREQLAKETGLPMRVIQVWFQNKRSKERRMKQLTSMGRGPFFGGARKMRGFPMNLSPGGLDEAGFPYFSHDGKFEFGYGGPPFHSHGSDAPFFPGHPIGPLPFNASGPIDHPNTLPMVNEMRYDTGGMTPESNFMNQSSSNQSGSGGGVNGPGNQDHIISNQRNASPSEFLGSSNFSEPQNLQNEGLVW